MSETQFNLMREQAHETWDIARLVEAMVDQADDLMRVADALHDCSTIMLDVLSNARPRFDAARVYPENGNDTP